MTRSLRIAIGLPPMAVICVAGFLLEAADDLITALHDQTRDAALRLDAWMEGRL